jgi:putative membrane protein
MSEPNAPAPFYFEPTRQSPIAILVILAKLIRVLIGQLWPVLAVILLGRNAGKRNVVLLWIMAGVGVFSIARAFLIYFRTRFYVEDGEFIFEKGGFVRSRLSVPLDKIQTITFQQSFLHRLFNVVSVEMDTSGSKGSEININALERKKANELREYLLTWKKENVHPESGEGNPDVEKTPEIPLLQLGFGELLRIGLSQNHLRSAGILIGLAFSFAGEIQPILGKSTYEYLTEELGLSFNVFWSFALWITLFFLIVAVFATLVLTIVRFYELRFVQTGEGFRLEAGLFNRREQAAYPPKNTIPALEC